MLSGLHPVGEISAFTFGMAALAVILVLFFLCVMRDKEEPAGLCRFHGCDLDATTNWKSVPVCAEHKDWLDNEQ